MRRWLLRSYFGFLALLAAIRLYDAYRLRHPWIVGDWLIHYAGGFVRRGLWGQGLYEVSQWTGLNIGALAALSTGSVYLGFLFFAYRGLAQQPTWRAFWITLTAPFLFWFPVLDVQGAYRKESLIFALYAWLVQGVARAPASAFRRTEYALMLLPALLLSHEALMAWAPFLLVPLAHAWPKTPEPRPWGRLLALVALNGLVWVATLAARGTAAHEQAILHALQQAGYALPYADHAIAWLDVTLAYQWHYQIERWRQWDVAWRMLIFPGVASVAFLPLVERVRRVYATWPARVAAGLSAFMTVVLMFVAKDWGRFAHAYAMMFFLSLLSRREPIPLVMRPRTLWILYGLFGLGYGLTWQWHHVHGFRLTGLQAWEAALEFYANVLHRGLGE
ncbi:MAG: hypothetical protein GXO36_04670 [Chloroflexi bacterium]|nr:hypothetical protein [Chloroflexota bacterium]